MATFKCMQEDRVVNNTLCPGAKPTTVRICKTCENGCNPDGSCVAKCHQKEICNFISNSTLNEHEIQKLLCMYECCKCNNSSNLKF